MQLFTFKIIYLNIFPSINVIFCHYSLWQRRRLTEMAEKQCESCDRSGHCSHQY